jgi:hypothetical protein
VTSVSIPLKQQLQCVIDELHQVVLRRETLDRVNSDNMYDLIEQIWTYMTGVFALDDVVPTHINNDILAIEDFDDVDSIDAEMARLRIDTDRRLAQLQQHKDELLAATSVAATSVTSQMQTDNNNDDDNANENETEIETEVDKYKKYFGISELDPVQENVLMTITENDFDYISIPQDASSLISSVLACMRKEVSTESISSLKKQVFNSIPPQLQEILLEDHINFNSWTELTTYYSSNDVCFPEFLYMHLSRVLNTTILCLNMGDNSGSVINMFLRSNQTGAPIDNFIIVCCTILDETTHFDAFVHKHIIDGVVTFNNMNESLRDMLKDLDYSNEVVVSLFTK